MNFALVCQWLTAAENKINKQKQQKQQCYCSKHFSATSKENKNNGVVIREQSFFVSLLNAEKDLLFGDWNPAITNKARNTAWDMIANKMRAKGAVFQSVRQLRKVNLNRIQVYRKLGCINILILTKGLNSYV